MGILGDLEDVEIALGVRTERTTPEPAFPELFPLDREPVTPEEDRPFGSLFLPKDKAAFKKANPKVKAKRKMAKQSRKKSRKKKK